MKDFLYLLSETIIRYFGKILILVLLFGVFHCSYIQANAKNYHCLNIKEVVDIEDKIGIDSNYEYGKRLFPQYTDAELSENFLVKKIPDLSLCRDDIRLIEVEREPFTQPHLTPGYVVSIHLQSVAASKISEYTKRNIDKQIALEIDGRSFAVPTILEQVKVKMRLFVGADLEEIKRELGKISNNIVIHDNK